MDIVDASVIDAFQGERIDYIYHLACPTGVPNLVVLAEEMLKTCSLGTIHVLELARKHGSRVLLTSSAEAYGDPQEFPQREDYTGNVDPIGPRSAYEEGKRFSEACVATYVRKYGVSAVIVRIFNTYGPGMSLDDTRVIPQFLRNVRDKKPFKIYGDGSQTRTHLFVDDLVNGLRVVMEKGRAGEVYNTGGNTSMSIRALAELVISLTGHEAGINFQPHFIHDHAGRCPSTEKVRELGWEQHVSLEDGLRRMLAVCLPTLVTSSAVTLEKSTR